MVEEVGDRCRPVEPAGGVEGGQEPLVTQVWLEEKVERLQEGRRGDRRRKRRGRSTRISRFSQGRIRKRSWRREEGIR